MRFTATFIRSCLIPLMVLSVWGTKPAAREQQTGAPPPESKIIDKWRGTWDVSATRRHPQPAQALTYVETADWVLDGKYLRSESSRKPDGGQSITMFWFDVFTKKYRVVLFDNSGFTAELPPGVWNAGTQTMEWKTGRLAPTSYAGHVTFETPDRIRWKSLWKDWKGTVILEFEGTSTRRK